MVALTTQQTRGEVLVVGGRVLYQSDTPDIDYVFTGHPGGFAHNYIGPVFASHPVITPRCECRLTNTQHNAAHCNAMLWSTPCKCHAVHCNTMLWSTPCNAMQYTAIPCFVQHRSMQCTMQCNILQYHALVNSMQMQYTACNIMLCATPCTMLCRGSTMQCNAPCNAVYCKTKLCATPCKCSTLQYHALCNTMQMQFTAIPCFVQHHALFGHTKILHSLAGMATYCSCG